jgi:hypothetical protein
VTANQPQPFTRGDQVVLRDRPDGEAETVEECRLVGGVWFLKTLNAARTIRRHGTAIDFHRSGPRR